MRKSKKIKPKYEKYSNFFFIIITVAIFTLLFFYAKKQEIHLESEENGNSATVNESSNNFQPGDDEKPTPGKLKWGTDFNFAKDQ